MKIQTLKTPVVAVNLSPFRHILTCAAVPLHHLEVTGEDAIEFIQGQSTQSLANEWRVHAFLERTGKLESYFIAWKEDKKSTILVSALLVERVKQRFEKYVISEDVEVKDLGLKDYWFHLGSDSLLEGIPGRVREQLVTIHERQIVHADISSPNELMNYFNWQGWPDITTEISVGELINQSMFFDAAVDLKKGCFPGQEVVAKIHNNRGAAWSPVLLLTKNKYEPGYEIKLEDKVVAKILTSGDDGVYPGTILRDVRVEGINLGHDFQVKLYPRWVSSAQERASELFHLGSEQFAIGHESEALEIWKNAILIDAKHADAYEAIGVLLGRQQKFVEAEEWMRKLLEVDPGSVMAHTNLSLFLMRQNKIQEAEDHKAKATVAQFAVFGQQAAQAKAEAEAKTKKAEELAQRERMFKEVLEIDADDALANYGLGTIELERGHFNEAKDLLIKVLVNDANYAVAYLALGKAHLALSQTDEAKSIWEKGIKIAAKKGEMMPANEMQSLLAKLL